MQGAEIAKVLRRISEIVGTEPDDLAVTVESRTGDPFRVLVSTILSLRARDEITAIISPALLSKAPTPEAMSALRVEDIENIIRTGSFYKTKARHLKSMAADIVQRYGGRVPNTMDGLLSLKGVGRKSANLVLSLGFGQDAVCVDTHVHRISNRIGFVHTSKPGETEEELRKVLPRSWWTPINGVLIAFGRKQCTPAMPKCATCPVANSCAKRGVG